MIFSKKHYFIFISSFIFMILFSYFFLDKTIAHYFLTHTQTYEKIGHFISIGGESHWYFAAAIIGFVLFRYIKKNEVYAQRALFLLYINLFSGLISLVLKHLFARMRPWGMREGADEYGFLLFQNFDMGFIEKMHYHLNTLIDASTVYLSFPSGHTTTVFTIFTYLSLLFPRYLSLWLSLALILASSRILANDHFLSDIFAGILVGTLCSLYIYSKMKEKIEKVY